MSTSPISYRPRILFLGENWYGSCARACCYALRRLGCDVTDIDLQAMIPQWRRRSNRAIIRLLHSRIVREYNQLILDTAAHVRPDILLAFKGTAVTTSTLRSLRSFGITLYNYFPDTIPSEHGSILADSIHHYDCIFYTKKFWATNPPDRLAGRPMVFLPHGYDPEIHRPVELSESGIEHYTHDVTVIASHTAHKENVLAALVKLMPEIDLHIYGDRWKEASRASMLKRHIRGMGLFGMTYAKAICAARLNLAITSWSDRPEVDETTTRTYEIPACGGFMLHERSPELLDLYDDGKEVACFGSVEELAEQIQYYLAHPGEREAIARAGHARCVPAYSYDERMLRMLRQTSTQADNAVTTAFAS